MKKLLFLLTLLLLLLSIRPLTISADEFQELDKEIEELKRKIDEAQSKERTLAAEIKSMDHQIRLKTLEVAETEEKIKKLGEEIVELSGKINRLETTLSRLSEVLLNRIVTSYKVNRVSYLSLLFSADGLVDFINRVKYIQLAQTHDREVLTEVQITKVDYSEQKDLREKKKLEQEELKIKLEEQKASLDKQKNAKQALLVQTKNDEATYQKLLQQALAEKQALEAALVSGVKVGSVKTGEPIALVGNTGYPACSTGAHLHFEVRKDNSWVNASEYLKSRSIADHQNGGTTSMGSGSWEWPLEGEVIVTQHYGKTPYSWRYAYSGGIHTGIDMYSDTSAIIRAPKDGILYTSSQDCGGSVIKIKFIEHSDGIISFYLHVQ